MNIIILFVCLGLAYKIYSTTGESRYNWFIGGLLFIYSTFVIIEKPQIPAHRLFVIAFLVSLIKNREICWNDLRGNPLFFPLLAYAVGLTLIPFMSPYLSPFYKLYKPLMRFLDTYLIILIGYYGVKDVKLMNSKITCFLIIVTLYGIFTLITSVDPYRFIMGDSKDFYDEYFFGERRRVASTWSHPISYGLICSVFFYMYYLFSENRYKFVVLLLLAISVFICGSRSALLVWLFIGVVLMFTILTKRQFVIWLLIFSSISFILPPVQQKMQQLISSIEGSDDTDGSSMEMRGVQLAASWEVASQFPLTGGGLDYIQEQMDFGTDDWVDDEGFYGFESYFFSLVIERGVLGVLVELFLIIYISKVFMKRKSLNNVYAFMGTGFVWGFLIFALITGPLDSWTITMFYIGVLMKQMEIDSQEDLINNCIDNEEPCNHNSSL